MESELHHILNKSTIFSFHTDEDDNHIYDQSTMVEVPIVVTETEDSLCLLRVSFWPRLDERYIYKCDLICLQNTKNFTLTSFSCVL